MTNAEVKAFWLKHNKKPRVQYQISFMGLWEGHPPYVEPEWVNHLAYRVHPQDLIAYGQREPTNPMKTLDPTKPVQTRGGQPVRILCTDRKSCNPVVGLVLGRDPEDISSWPLNGQVGDAPSHLDLVNVDPLRTALQGLIVAIGKTDTAILTRQDQLALGYALADARQALESSEPQP